MVPLQDFCFRKVLLLYLVLLVFFSSVLILVSPHQIQSQNPLSIELLGRRSLLQVQNDEIESHPIKKKPSTSTNSLSTKNKTKLIKPTDQDSIQETPILKIKLKKLNSTKPTTNSSISTKNKTKLIKPTAQDSIQETPILKIKLKKLNSTKPTSLLSNKSSDLTKITSTKNKTTQAQAQLGKTDKKPNNTQKKPTQPSWIYQEDDDDLVAEFRDLPSKFQETLLPDLEKISTTSKVYLNKYNKEITKGFKPIVGNKYAPTVASVVSCAFILIPLLLVSLIFNRIKAYFSLQKLLIFIQIYLSIYFSILCLSSLVTGLEPLKFFYATSQSTYVCMQLLQTLGYVLYLLVLLMYLVLVFSTESGMGLKLLGLGQTFVGFAVGLHYYMTVFHRAVLRQPPKTSWRVHAIYATCFLMICLLATAERRKKVYLAEDGGEEGKKS